MQKQLTTTESAAGIRLCALILLILVSASPALALSSANIPLNSPVYGYLDKLAEMGLITSDIKANKTFESAEAALLVIEATKNIAAQETAVPAWSSTFFRFVPPKKPDPISLSLARELVTKIRELLPPEAFLKSNLDKTQAAVKSSHRKISSANIPLNSPMYGYFDKLAGMGLITSDVKGLRPYSKAEAARLTLEAVKNIAQQDTAATPFAMQLVARIRELLPREMFLRENPEKKPAVVDVNPVASLRARYVNLDGAARDYKRPVFIRGGQSAFGFIGGSLRPLTDAGVLSLSGTEGTPLVENNNGVAYKKGNNAEIRLSAEGYVSGLASALVEPMVQYSPGETRIQLNRGYVKLGGGGLELEVGRDENWFGPGHRGALTLSSNARNFDQIKLSSPEPLDVNWVKRWLGDVKYALVLSRFDETDAGTANYRQPYFIGLKLALKPYSWFEYGFNFVRQQGGPGFTGTTTIQDEIFGGGTTNHTNTIAGIDLRFRIPWLRNTEVYGEYAGEDSASFWPIVESYVAGIYAPCLTSSCRDDLRFEFFWGNPMLYTDFKFPRGYTYNNMTPGHSQGGAAQDFFVRYSHSFSARNVAAIEYFHTDRGQEGRVKVNSSGVYDPAGGNMQAMEHKDAGRFSWSLPIYGDVDGQLQYGIEKINNLNLIEGVTRTNQLATFELRYRY